VLQLVENVRTDRGPRQRVVVSLGTRFKIPKLQRSTVARIIKERLSGTLSLFSDDPKFIQYADYVVKKIQTEGKWDSARQRVSEFKEADRRTAKIFIDGVEHGYTRELGAILIGDTFWNRLNFPSILRECGFREIEIKTAEISVLNRLISQDSENGIIPWLRTVAVDELLDTDFMQFGNDRFYRISDKLLKHQSYIEEELYQREKDLFSLEDCIFLYDLTNTYFEGVCARNPKAKYSKNQKEKRSDCPQVVVALVLDGDGFIRRHRVFEGKVSDAKSLRHIVAEFKSEFSDKPMPTIIFDRGMVTEENIEFLKSYENLKYIVMCRSNEEEQFIDTFQKGNFDIVEGRDPKKKVEVLLKPEADIVYLLCKSEGRKNKEQAMRNNREERLEKDLTNLQNQIQKGRENNPVKIEQRIGRIKERYGKVSQYYEITYTHREFSYALPENEKISKRVINSLGKLKGKADCNKITFPALEKKLAAMQEQHPSDFDKIKMNLMASSLSWAPIDEIREKEAGLDGNYLLKTNRKDLNADKIWKLYVMLTRIENAFRDLKSYLGLRPNPHHRENRVDGHIFISIQAYHLLHSIEYTLRENDVYSRWATIKRVLSTHVYSTIQLPTTTGPVINIRKPGTPEGIHKEIYDKLEVDYKNLPVRRNLA
jgi:hypothetical protein